MEKKIVTFKGISNVPDDGLNEAGDMSVLLNMRHKGGELVPCQPPFKDPMFEEDIVQALWHTQSERWLAVTKDGYLKEHNPMSQNPFSVKNVKSFALLGNMVIINFEDGVGYALWRERDRKYIYIGGVPEMPKLIVSLTKTSYEEEFSGMNNDPYSDEYHYRFQKGVIDKVLASVYENKGYVDRAWFRLGVKLFDGSYIDIGEIHELSNYPNMAAKNIYDEVTEKIIGVQHWWKQKESAAYYSKLEYFIPNFSIVCQLGDWKDLIASIDLFCTGSILSVETCMATKDIVGVDVPAGIEIYNTRSPEQLRNALLSAEFYKVAEFDVEGKQTWSISNTSPSNIAVQDKLGKVVTHSIIPNNSMTYNARLHTYGYREQFFNGYSSATSNYGVNKVEDRWTVYVHIKTDDKNIVVKRVDDEAISTSEKEYRHLNYFSYPDSRAYRMDIFNGDKQCTLMLSPHPYKNEAVYLNVKEVEVNIEGYAQQYVSAISEISWKDAGNQPSVNNGVDVNNILKVSAVDNPFYFPTVQTYKFEGEIVGLASNAEAISPGQFGTFPLFVFTKEGIWAMQVDTSGQGAYTTQSPFSREVCNGAICPVSGGVVFSTDKGVMVVSGGQVADLSAVLDGFEVDFFKYNADMWNAIFAKAGKGVVNPVPIREYIKDAVIAYNYHYNEIIVSNKALFEEGAAPYSYVYSLTNKVWSVIDTVFDLTTNKYPELVVFDKGGGKMYTFEDGVANNKVVAITRPFTLGSFDFKRLRQAGLRTTFEGQLNFYLLGSNDGANFVCITGKEAAEVKDESGEVKTRRDLITAMSRSKQYKYFAIAIAGQMSGRVSMAELLVDAGFAINKLR